MEDEDDEMDDQHEDVDVEGAIWKEVQFSELKDGNDGGFNDRRHDDERHRDAIHKIFVDRRSETQYPRLVIEVNHSRNAEYFGASFDVHTSSKFSAEDWWSDQLYYPMSVLPEVIKMLEEFQKKVKPNV
jgi:hypothetical protein